MPPAHHQISALDQPALHQQPALQPEALAVQQPTLMQHVDSSPNTPINVTITYNLHRQQLPELPGSPPKPLKDHASSEFNYHNVLIRPPHTPLSLGQPDGITNMLNQHSRTVSRGLGHHSHRLRPLLKKTTVIQGRSLPIAQQARLNSSRTRKSTSQSQRHQTNSK